MSQAAQHTAKETSDSVDEIEAEELESESRAESETGVVEDAPEEEVEDEDRVEDALKNLVAYPSSGWHGERKWHVDCSVE